MMKPFVKTHVLILDFEANCSNDQMKDHEIIEFPAVLLNLKTKQIQSEFRTFVKMQHHTNISDFIKELTHITDEDLTNGMTWVEALMAFEVWCDENGVTSRNTTVICCGDWDLKTMLPKQLELHGTKITPKVNELFSSWVNIKTTYKKVMKKKRRIGMAEMLSELNIPLVGHHHSGIDDCRNIVNICLELHNRGYDITSPNNFKSNPFWYENESDLSFKRTKFGHIQSTF